MLLMVELGGSARPRPRHHRVISRPILAVQHLRGVLVNGLRAPHIHILFVFEHSSLLLDNLLVRRVALFEPLGITQRVQSMVARGAARADAREHYNFDFIAGQEGVSQDHG